MIEKFFALKIWTEFIIPTVLIVAIIIVVFVFCFVYVIRWNRKKKWLKNNGYEQYLLIPGNENHGAIYEWKNKETMKSIREDDAERMTYRKLVQKMK